MTTKYLLKAPKYTQKDLFGCVLKQRYLFDPNSPKKAFYSLFLEINFGQYLIRKESGIGSTVLDRRLWAYDSLEKAEKSFNRIIHQKTRPDRKSSRRYIEIPEFSLDTIEKSP